MAPQKWVRQKRQHPGTEPMKVVEDGDVLDCGICYQPLKPPIFQCDEGHALCSSCHDKLLPKGKCHVCGISTVGGYRRCRTLERVVESVHVACPNAAHGCDARPVYYDLASHRKVCSYGSCHCPSEACTFIGTRKQLVDHITSSHGWPCTNRVIMPHELSVRLQDGFNFLVFYHIRIRDKDGVIATSNTGVFLFLLNVSRQPLGRTVSVFRIRPQHTCDGLCMATCMLQYSGFIDKSKRSLHHYLLSKLSVECTDLSDGLPDTDECFKFLVPNSAVQEKDKEAMVIKVAVSFPTTAC